MKKTLVYFLLFCVYSVKAQIGITGGGSVIRPFGGNKVSYYGLGLGVEFANDDQSTIYLNFSAGIPNSVSQEFQLFANDFTTVPYNISTTGKITNNIYALEGGNRRYLIGDAFDYGFGLYGGTSYQILICRAKVVTDGDYDRSLYTVHNSIGALPDVETVLSGGIGLHLGIKHQFARGVIFLESSVAYQILPFSSSGSVIYMTDYSRLNFRTLLGYRKDIWN